MHRTLNCSPLLALALIAAFALPTQLRAADLSSPFTAVCDATRVHRYDFGVGLNGDVLWREWTTDDKYGRPWLFHWIPPNKLMLDDEELVVMAKVRGVLVSAIRPGGKALAAVNVHSYAINLRLRSVVFAHVQATDLLGPTINTRAVELACVFKFG